MKAFHYSSIVGILATGIVFNLILSILGNFGVTLLDALYITLLLLAIIGTCSVMILNRWRR